MDEYDFDQDEIMCPIHPLKLMFDGKLKGLADFRDIELTEGILTRFIIEEVACGSISQETIDNIVNSITFESTGAKTARELDMKRSIAVAEFLKKI